MILHKWLLISISILFGQKIGVSSFHEQLFQSEKYQLPAGTCYVGESLFCEAKKLVNFEKIMIKIITTVQGFTKLLKHDGNCICQTDHPDYCTCCLGSTPIPFGNILQFVLTMISTWKTTSDDTLRKAFSDHEIHTKGFYSWGLQTCTWDSATPNCTYPFELNGNRITNVYQRIDFCKIATKITNTILEVQNTLIQENNCTCKAGPAENAFCKVCVLKGPQGNNVTKLVGKLIELWAD